MNDSNSMIDDRNFPSPVCSFCSRLRSLDKHQCDAFPVAIPEDIWIGTNTHQTVVTGDNGLQFNWVDQPDGQESEAAKNLAE